VDVRPSLKRKNRSETCSFNHCISFSLCFLKFMQSLIHTRRFHIPYHHECGSQHKHSCLHFMFASRWMAAVGSHWLQISRNMSRHSQRKSNKIQQCIKISFHISLKLNMSIAVFMLLWKHMSGWELECSDAHGDRVTVIFLGPSGDFHDIASNWPWQLPFTFPDSLITNDLDTVHYVNWDIECVIR